MLFCPFPSTLSLLSCKDPTEWRTDRQPHRSLQPASVPIPEHCWPCFRYLEWVLSPLPCALSFCLFLFVFWFGGFYCLFVFVFVDLRLSEHFWVSFCPFLPRKGVTSLAEFLVCSHRRADVLAQPQISISSLMRKTKNSWNSSPWTWLFLQGQEDTKWGRTCLYNIRIKKKMN